MLPYATIAPALSYWPVFTVDRPMMALFRGAAPALTSAVGGPTRVAGSKYSSGRA